MEKVTCLSCNGEGELRVESAEAKRLQREAAKKLFRQQILESLKLFGRRAFAVLALLACWPVTVGIFLGLAKFSSWVLNTPLYATRDTSQWVCTGAMCGFKYLPAEAEASSLLTGFYGMGAICGVVAMIAFAAVALPKLWKR